MRPAEWHVQGQVEDGIGASARRVVLLGVRHEGPTPSCRPPPPIARALAYSTLAADERRMTAADTLQERFVDQSLGGSA